MRTVDTSTNPPTQTVRYLANDHLGGTAVVLDASGGVETHTRYTPFGQSAAAETQTGGTPATDKLFTGHERKGATSGLYYADARYGRISIFRRLRRSASAASSISATLPFRIVNPNTTRGLPPGAHTAPGTPSIRASCAACA